MSRSLYEEIIFPLPQNLKMKARIEGLRFEQNLYQLNIEYLNKRILDSEKMLTESLDANIKESIVINIKEFEVKIMDYQTKMKLCDIKICREEYNLKNYKEF